MRSRFVLLAMLLPPLLLGGCAVDTEIFTEFSADGAAVRTLRIKLQDLDRKKEGEAWPVKRFKLPAPPDWTLLEDTPAAFAARAEIAPGRPVPGGYEREVPCLQRAARNTVRFARRDHFLACSYSYEERFSDTVRPDEFQAALLAEYDRYSARLLDSAEKEFGATHDLTAVRRYASKDLRKLFEDAAATTVRSGPWSAALTAVGRLFLGGFPIKPAQLAQADARHVLGALIRHCMDKSQLKPDAQQALDEKEASAALAALSGTDEEKRAAARKALLEWGPRVLRRLEAATAKPKDGGPASAPPTPAEETAKEIRAALVLRLDGLVARLVKETEEHYLRPPADEKEAVEKILARMLGGHLEATFAPCDHSFLLRARLPGELAALDSNGQRNADGTVRWTFTFLDFFLREHVCAARSRVWNEARVAALGQALLGDPKALTVRMKEDAEELLAKLDDAALARVITALAESAAQTCRVPLDMLAGDAATPAAAAAAKDLLEKLRAPAAP